VGAFQIINLKESVLSNTRPEFRRPPRQTQDLIDDLARARLHLERRTEDLTIIADWRDDLMVRIARARLRAERIGLPSDEQQALEAEVADFVRYCRVLGWNPDIKGNGRAAA